MYDGAFPDTSEAPVVDWIPVISPTRLAAVLLCAAAAVCTEGRAQTPPVAVPPLLLPVQSQWSMSATAESSYGYKDNLLLSGTGEERSAFARGSLSFLLLRATTGSFDSTFFGQIDGSRYFSGTTIDHDAKAWTQTEFGYRFGDTLKVSLPLTGYYSDQVFDVSDTEVERLVARLKVRGGMAGPLVHWTIHPAWWLEAQAVGEAKRYADGSNDGRVGEGALRLGWKRGERVELRLAALQRWRGFDRRSCYTAAGRELTGTRLKIAEREYQVRADVTWDAAGAWRTMTRAGVLDYRDNGSGYFNFREHRLSQELEWKGAVWSARVAGTAKRMDFHVQTVGFGLAPPPRIKDEYQTEVHLERKLGRNWTAIAEYTWERTRSNDTIASYLANEGLLGLRWSWEK